MAKSKYVKPVDNSEDTYARLKPITDAAQSGALEPWSPSVIDLLARYKVNVQRLEDVKAQANLSFPTSVEDHRSMAIGFRYAKDDVVLLNPSRFREAFNQAFTASGKI